MKNNNIAAPHAGPSRLPDSKQAQAPPPRQSWRSRSLTLAAKSAACLAALLFAGVSSVSATDFCVNPGFEDGVDPAAPPWSFWGGTGGALPNPVSGGDNTTPRVWSNFGNPTYVNIATQNNMNDVWLIPGATYHFHAQYYVPSSEVQAGVTPIAGFYLTMYDNTSRRVLDPRYTDGVPNDPRSAIPVQDAWYTYDIDWVNPGTVPERVNYGSFRLYGWDGTALGAQNPGGYFDNCQISSDAYTGTVSGLVKDISGLLQDASVAITYQGNPFRSTPVGPITTLSDGAYSFAGLIPGETYSVTVSKAGYVSQTVTGVAPEVLGDITLEQPATFTINSSVVGGNGSIAPTPSASVLQGASQTFTFTADPGYVPDQVTIDTDAPIPAGASYTFTDVQADHTIAVTFKVDPDYDPDLLYSVRSSAYTGGSTWPTAYSSIPGISSLATMGTPTVRTINGQNWVVNKRDGDGFRYTNIPQPGTLPFNGGTIVVAARPIRYTPGNAYQCLVSNLLFQFTLGVQRDSGQILVLRKGTWYWGPNIPNGQITVFSVVVQPDGQFKVYLNGDPTPVMNITDTSTFTDLTASEWYGTDVSVGKGWNGDGWSSFNGDIGDVYVYLNAIDDTKREALEDSLITKYGSAEMFTIDSSAATGGTISPTPSVAVPQNADQAIVITPDKYFDVSSVIVDAATTNTEVVSGPNAQTYTFTNVTEAHTIDAYFTEWVNMEIVGKVTTDGTTGVPGVLITATGGREPYTATTSDPSGTYSIRIKPGVTYTLTASKTGYTIPGSLQATGPDDLTGKDFIATFVGTQKLIDIKVDPAFVDDATLTSWPNTGTLGGQFVADGGWDTNAPTTRASIGGMKAIQFNGNKMMLSSTTSSNDKILAPSSITGPGSNFTVFARLYAEGAGQYDPWEQFFLAWSRRGGPEGTCASFGYGKGWWGAIGGWGFGDTNYGTLYPGTDRTVAPAWGQWNDVAMTSDGTTVTIYYNGLPVNTVTKTLNWHSNMPFSLGSQFWGDSGEGREIPFNGAMASLEVYDAALDASQIAALSGLVSRTISGTISDAGGPAEGALVSLNNGATVVAGPVTTGPGGTYSLDATFADGATCTVSASKSGSLPGTLDVPITAGVSDYPNSDILLASDPYYDPNLIFSMTVDGLAGLTPGAPTGNRATVYPSGGSMVALGSPTVIDVDGLNWQQNINADADGYRFVAPENAPSGQYSAPIPASGASIVAVVQPNYVVVAGEQRGEIVSLFYSELFLAVNHGNGEVIVNWRGYSQHNTGYFIPNGAKTILCLVVQPTGEVALYADGAMVWTAASGQDYNTLQPLTWAKTITVGRNDFDGWSTFSGNVGDVFLYKTAISNEMRVAMQGELATKFGITLPTLHTITASSDTNGTISPSGDVEVVEGQDKTFNFYPTAGFVDVVTVDGIDEPGHPASYTFFNVTGPHTISVTFTVAPPPANDNFVDAIDLTGVEAGQTGAVTAGTQAGTYNFAATKEVDEPAFAYVGPDYEQSVWFKWTAPSNGNFTIDTYGSMNVAGQVWDSVIYLYDGASLASLNSLATVDNGQAETATIPVTTGTTYYVRLAWGGGPSGNAATQRDTPDLHLTWSLGAGGSFAEWAAINAGSQTPGEDYNNDGVANGVAYFMGVSGIATNPGLGAGNTVIWPMSATFSGDYEVQTSPDLGTWINVTPKPLPVGGNLSYTLPPDLGKQFVRLLVIPD